MGLKLLWTSLTFIFAFSKFFSFPAELVGAVFMIVGLVLLFLDK